MVNIVRKALESQYKDTCTIEELKSNTDAVTGIVDDAEDAENDGCWIPVHEDKPCKLSIKSNQSANETDTYTAVSQEIKLFLAPELTVKEGSRIKVLHEGTEKIYEQSGIPAVYSNHQEILLKSAKDKA